MDDSELEIYRLYSQLKNHRWQIERSLRIIENGLKTMTAPYLSISFGKDSLVMAHLIWSHFPGIPGLYVNCGEFDEWPDTPRVKQAFLALFPQANFTELQAPSIFEVYQSVGFYIQDEETTRDARKAQRDYSKSLAEALDNEAKKRGYDGAFIGLRAEESYNRSRLFFMRGNFYFAKERGAWACHPLEKWTSKDIWAYIVSHGLPYNELYDLAPEGRELARNGAMFGSRSARYGRLAFFKRVYPELFNRFAAEFPEVRLYV